MYVNEPRNSSGVRTFFFFVLYVCLFFFLIHVLLFSSSLLIIGLYLLCTLADLSSIEHLFSGNKLNEVAKIGLKYFLYN